MSWLSLGVKILCLCIPISSKGTIDKLNAIIGHYFFPDLYGKYLYHSQEIIMIIGDKFRSQLDFILFETDPHKSASVGQRNSIIWQRSLGEALPSHPDQYAGDW